MKKTGMIILLGLVTQAASAAINYVEMRGLNFNAPTISGKANVAEPKMGEIIFDSSDETFYGNVDGTSLGWVQFAGAAGFVNQSSELTNASIASSVGSNALTVALKDKNGNDPAIGNPALIAFRDATSTVGSYNQRTITSALSMTVSSGSTLGCRNSLECRIYVYAVDSGSGVVLGVSQKLFDEGSVVSTTAEGGAGAADSAIVMYTASAQTSKPIRIIGRVRITETTAGTWASAASEISDTPFNTNMVTSSSAFQVVESSVVNNGTGASCTVASVGQNWMNATGTRNAAGNCTFTFNPAFSAAPQCVCSSNGTNSISCVANNLSTTSMTVYTFASGGIGLADENNVQIICKGTR